MEGSSFVTAFHEDENSNTLRGQQAVLSGEIIRALRKTMQKLTRTCSNENLYI